MAVRTEWTKHFLHSTPGTCLIPRWYWHGTRLVHTQYLTDSQLVLACIHMALAWYMHGTRLILMRYLHTPDTFLPYSEADSVSQWSLLSPLQWQPLYITRAFIINARCANCCDIDDVDVSSAQVQFWPLNCVLSFVWFLLTDLYWKFCFVSVRSSFGWIVPTGKLLF